MGMVRDGKLQDGLPDSERLIELVGPLGWRFAKTYATWGPHEYIARAKSCEPGGVRCTCRSDRPQRPTRTVRWPHVPSLAPGRGPSQMLADRRGGQPQPRLDGLERGYRMGRLIARGDFVFGQSEVGDD